MTLFLGDGANTEGQGPNQGRSPFQNFICYGGAEPRLTSGGEAGGNESSFNIALDSQDGISHQAAKPERHGLTTLKLSKITGPGESDSTCHVPPLSSNRTDVIGTDASQRSL